MSNKLDKDCSKINKTYKEEIIHTHETKTTDSRGVKCSNSKGK